MFYLKPREVINSDAERDWSMDFSTWAAHVSTPMFKHYFEQGMVNKETLIKDAPMVAVDFETTGLDCQRNSIVSIAVVPMSAQRIFMSQARQWVVKPRQDLTDESVVIHGITHSDIQSAPDIEAILPELLDLVAGKIWVVHYNGIERPFLQKAMDARFNEHIHFPVIDTMAIEARFHRQRRSFWSRLMGKRPLSIRLADSRERYNLPFYAPHDALTDALACAELLQAQIRHRYSLDSPLQDIWLP
ncbi:3'-5' exonuclease [Idiomarina baltica]|uniref:DNA polymerase III subunit epsilon n=1 Tax=Idiomarina baltica OS145 TaxID=314276 RepID=A0ABP2CRM5_9GAMM|nr:3'-5' exonuclease [Idiomarina baltica]EAQ32471.1 DNA polymerase III subunit epsilon [Idiomarina baltica OS145]